MKLHYPHTIRIDDAAEKKPRFNENRDVVGIYFWPFKHHFVLIWHHACAAVFSVGFRIFQNLFYFKISTFLKAKKHEKRDSHRRKSFISEWPALHRLSRITSVFGIFSKYFYVKVIFLNIHAQKPIDICLIVDVHLCNSNPNRCRFCICMLFLCRNM